nr:uncharacterized protein LOC117277574 [Nicotiana tomentosiformis]
MINNEAEYKAVIAGLRVALKYGAKRLNIRCDSQILDQIPHAQNAEADGLAKLPAATKSITTGDKSVVHLLNSSLGQIEDGTLANNKREAKKLRMQAARYSLFHSNLYKKTYGGSLEKCLGLNQTQRVLEEVHKDHCGAYSGNRALVRCLIRAGILLAHHEKGCLRLREKMRTMPKICPNDSPSRRTPPFGHLLMAIHQMGNGHRGPPPYRARRTTVTTDQFTGKEAAEFFEKWNIKRILSTPYHPAGNGQAESSIKSILSTMKKNLEDAKGLWPEIAPY